MRVCLLRHGPTAWTMAGRMQGRHDLPLSVAGREVVGSWRVPADFATAAWRSSPLRRARETALFMGCPEPELDDRLVEMAWGEFEGRTLAELRTILGRAFADLEARGLDFQPPGGESPRMVCERLQHLFGEVGRDGRDAVLVTHKGVLRAALAIATGWTMLGPPPCRLRDGEGLVVELSADGRVAGELRITPLNGA